ncbi:MAG: YdcF family protein [Actinomycetota bacterium]|nr:YdcF family protein [Actinomycetota bacterium]
MFIFRLIRRVISFILLLIIAIPLYVAGSIWYSARNSEPVKSDVILVMGAAQFDGRPSDVLLARLKQTKIIFNDKVAPRIYTIGAGAPGDRTTEAAASRNWLVSNGIKKSNILAIAKGRDTLSSTKTYAAQMKKSNLSSVVIVTDPYHCFRAVKMAQDQDLIPTCSPVKSGLAAVENSSFKYLARETGALLAYVTVGRVGIKLSDRS